MPSKANQSRITQGAKISRYRRMMRAWEAWYGRTVLLSLLVAGSSMAAAVYWAQSSGHMERVMDDARQNWLAAHEWFAEKAQLRVKQVYVEGRERMPADQLRAVVDVVEGDAIMSIDLDELQGRLEESGWVKDAHIQRSLPDTIHITIEERKPVAIWQHAGALAVIDGDGLAIASEDPRRYAYLPVIVGVSGAERASQLLMMLQAEPTLFKQVAAATLVGQRRWDVRFFNDMVVQLPEIAPELAWAKLGELDKKYQIMDKAVGKLDMRLPERSYIQLLQRPVPEGESI